MPDRTPDRRPPRRRRRDDLDAAAAATPPWPPAADAPLDTKWLHELVADMLGNDLPEDEEPQISIRRRGRPSKRQRALDQANDMVSEAEELDAAAARELARAALAVSPDCAAAHVLLAQLSADVAAAAEEYRLGIAAGERALGPAVIEKYEGQLGQVFEAWDYLQARRGLAECLVIEGRPTEALAECGLLARLDADDRVEIRFMHLDLLISGGRFAEARQFCEAWSDEPLCHWRYGRALAAFGADGDSPEARRLLDEAIAANPHVPRLLLAGDESGFDDEAVTVGEEDEAAMYVHHFRRCWMDVPGALAWLRDAARVPLEQPRHPADPALDSRDARLKRRRRSWAAARRRLVRLPLDDADEWEVDVWREPGGEWSLLAASVRDAAVVAIDLRPRRPSTAALWKSLTEAMFHPTNGDPRRPGSVALRPGVFPDTWSRRLGQIGVRTVSRPSLDTLDRITCDVAERAAADEAARIADAIDPAGATTAVLAEVRGLPTRPDETWEAVVRRSLAWVTGDGPPYLPWMAMLASRGSESMLKATVTRQRPDHAALVRLAGRAMIAAGCRPGRLEMIDGDAADAIRTAFAGLDVEASAATLPTIDRLVAVFAESMAPGGSVAPLVNVPGVTVEMAREFYAAAAAFHRDRPWRRVRGDLAIDVWPTGVAGVEGRLVHAVVMGQSGVVQGLAVYEDRADLDAGRSGDQRRVMEGTGLSVVFGEAFEIPAIDYERIEREGFDVAGPDAWPSPLRLNPGRSLRPPLAWELQLLTGCLRDVPAFIAAVPSPSRAAAPRDGSGASAWTSPAGWRLSWEVAPPAD